MTPDDLARRRFEYETAGLDPADVARDPMDQWWAWYRDAVAAGVTEPNAMTVATVDADGPDARIVLVRSVDERGLSFFSHHTSPKGRQAAATGTAAATFAWLQLHRQVRLRGTIETFGGDEADEYWASRPRDSQLASAASPQSQVIADRAELEARIADQAARWAGLDAVPRPEHWGGFRIRPWVVEFWQGRPARTHDRVRYRRVADAWILERLAP